jgi:hypothetical protein
LRSREKSKKCKGVPNSFKCITGGINEPEGKIMKRHGNRRHSRVVERNEKEWEWICN